MAREGGGKGVNRLLRLCREHLGARTVFEGSLPAALLPGAGPSWVCGWRVSTTRPSTVGPPLLPHGALHIPLKRPAHQSRRNRAAHSEISDRAAWGQKSQDSHNLIGLLLLTGERSKHPATGAEVEGEAAAIQTPFLTPPRSGVKPGTPTPKQASSCGTHRLQPAIIPRINNSC